LKNYIKVNWKNLKEMDKFINTYELPKLNQEDTNKPNRTIISHESKVVIKNLLAKKKKKARTRWIHC
jgi:hypothetical protein